MTNNSIQIGNETLLTQQAVADRLGYTVRTLEHWRLRRVGPAWCKIGARVMYRESSLEQWIRDQERQPVAAGGEAA